ncbi:hypothetical protein V3331_01890 [Gaopeijia maritima]|uniref:hypothetical protein n=1 Tax=Gaopeijia maritima TaxID=3119007 RepID=UPI003249A9FD
MSKAPKDHVAGRDTSERDREMVRVLIRTARKALEPGVEAVCENSLTSAELEHLHRTLPLLLSHAGGTLWGCENDSHGLEREEYLFLTDAGALLWVLAAAMVGIHTIQEAEPSIQPERVVFAAYRLASKFERRAERVLGRAS